MLLQPLLVVAGLWDHDALLPAGQDGALHEDGAQLVLFVGVGVRDGGLPRVGDAAAQLAVLGLGARAVVAHEARYGVARVRLAAHVADGLVGAAELHVYEELGRREHSAVHVRYRLGDGEALGFGEGEFVGYDVEWHFDGRLNGLDRNILIGLKQVRPKNNEVGEEDLYIWRT